MSVIKIVGIAGAGAMGSGIAQVFAQSNYPVVLYDTKRDQLVKAKIEIASNLNQAIARGKLRETDKTLILDRISFTDEIDSLKADLIIEAIVEQLEVKRELFKKLAEINSSNVIFATNTSSIPVTRLARDIPYPERVVGMHFFNPAQVLKLVEVISGVETSAAVSETIKGIVTAIGKIPITCKDSPGFIVNRVARSYYTESLKMLEEKVANAETIDAFMESAGFKMGPFKLMDHVGNDINYAVTSSLFESFHHEARFRPSHVQRQKLEAGYLGKKTGKGFYDYP